MKKITFSLGFGLLVTALITTNAIFAVGALGVATLYGVAGFIKGHRLS